MKPIRLSLLFALLLSVLISPSVVANAEAKATYPPGKFAWADLVTTDPEAAIGFYTKTFGWTTREVSGRQRYTVLLNHGEPVAGVAYRKGDAGGSGARWVGSIAVTDIKQAVAAVTAAGGALLVAPHQVAGLGKQAIVADQEGSVFGLLVSDAGPGATSKGADNGWAWVQLLARQPVAAAAFYEKALGYVVTDDARTARTDDYLLTRDGVAYAGLTALPELPGARGGWLGYVRVPRVPAAVDAAKASGAHVLFGPQDVPGGFQVAIIADPLGGAIGLVSRTDQTTTEAKK